MWFWLGCKEVDEIYQYVYSYNKFLLLVQVENLKEFNRFNPWTLNPQSHNLPLKTSFPKGYSAYCILYKT